MQDETGGFQTFIPLAFHPDNTPLQHLPKTTGLLDIKQIAVARLVLDNFPHIKAYWQMMTPKIAQIALRFGADDLDGTVIEEKIYHDAGATTPQGLRRQDLIRLITEAGRTSRARHAISSCHPRRNDLHRSCITVDGKAFNRKSGIPDSGIEFCRLSLFRFVLAAQLLALRLHTRLRSTTN